MKRIILFILAISLLLGIICPLCIFAEEVDTPLIYATDTSVTQGNTVTISIYASNLKSVGAMDIFAYYNPDVFEYSSYSVTNLVSGVAQTVVNTDIEGEVSFSSLSLNGISGSGEIFKLYLKAKSNAQAGTHYVTLAAGEAYNTALEPISISTTDCKVTVNEKQQTQKTVSIQASSTSSKLEVGDTLTVKFYTYNANGLASADFTLEYDKSVFNLKDITLGAALLNAQGAIYSVNKDNPGYANISYANLNGVNNTVNPMITATLEVIANVDTQTTVSLDTSNLYDSELNLMKSGEASRSFTISKVVEAPVYPDVTVEIDGQCREYYDVYIKVPGSTNLAAGDFTVTYDNTLLECISAEKVIENSMVIANIKNDESKVIFSFIYEAGISEDSSIVKLTFTPIKAFEQVTVNVTGKNLVNSSFNGITVNYISASALMHKNQAVAEAKEPTCNDVGWDSYKYCTDCQYDERKEIPALGHRVIESDKYIIDAYQLQNDTTYPFELIDGIYSSTNKNHSTKSNFKITALCSFTLKLKYSVSSESGCDKLIILKNGTTLDTISGIISWTEISIDLVAGDVVTIQYTKDGSVNSNNDTGYFEILTEQQIEIVYKTYVSIDEIETSCTEDIYCDVCGDLAKEAKGHAYVELSRVESTCSAAGSVTYTCPACGDSYEEALELAAHTEEIIPAVLPTPNNNGTTAGVKCTECGEVLVAPVENTVTITPSYKTFGINSTNLILGNNISLDYKVNVSEGYELLYMVFVFEDVEYIVTEYVMDGGKPLFNFAETRPHKMATNVKAYVYAATADGYAYDVYDYSVMKYCIAKLKKGENVNVISDLLAFGAATQKYVAQMTNTTVADEDLITSLVEAEGYTLTPTAFTSIPESEKAQYVDIDAADSFTWKSASVALGSSTEMVYKFTATDITGLQIKIEVDGVEKMVLDAADLEYDATAKRYIVSVNCVSAVQYGSEVKATFLINGVESDSVSYSINGFLYNNLSKNEGTVLGDLMKALYVYGDTTYNLFYNN